MNYSELCTAIQHTIESEFSATDLANFVQQAEHNIYNAVQLPTLRRSQVGTLSPGGPYVQVPSDMMSLYSVAIIDLDGDYHFLLQKDVSFMREAYPTASFQAIPTSYSFFGSVPANPLAMVLMLGPTPDQAYQIEIQYFYMPESIVTAGNTWLGDNFHTVLLNGALVEAARFLKSDPDMVKLYIDLYMQSITLLKNLSEGKFRQDAYRLVQATQPVK